MKFHAFLLLIAGLILTGCIDNAKKEDVFVEFCCLDSLEYGLVHHSFGIDSSFLSPSSIILKLVNCESVSKTTISSVIFPHVQLGDSSYFNVWAAGIESVQSPNTIFVNIHTNSFDNSVLSKDSIENLFSKQIKIITSKNDTIYIERCPKDFVQ